MIPLQTRLKAGKQAGVTPVQPRVIPPTSPLRGVYEGWERRLAEQLMRGWRRRGELFLAEMRRLYPTKSAAKFAVKHGSMSLGWRAAVKQGEAVGLPREFWEAWEQGYVDDLLPYMAEAVRLAFDLSVTDMEARFAVSVEPNLVHTDIQKWATEHTMKLVRQRSRLFRRTLTQTDILSLQNAVGDWVASTEAFAGLVDRVNAIVGNEARARMIASTEATRAYAYGNYLVWREGGVVNAARWNTAEDELVCPICGPLDDQVAALEEYFDGEYYPPAHPQCLPGNALVLPVGEIAAGSKRQYQGDLIRIETSKHNLSITPNHPVLTTRGWVAAQRLEVGDYVVGCSSGEWETLMVKRDDKHVVSKIKDIFDSLGISGWTMETSYPDFHGDVPNPDVAVIRPNSLLADDVEPLSGQLLCEHGLLRRALVWPDDALLGNGGPYLGLVGDDPALSSFVRGPSLVGPLLGRHLGPFQQFSGRLAAGFDTVQFQAAVDSTPTSANPDAILLSEAFCELQAAFPSPVALYKVTVFNRYPFSGHVYNLHTASGLYLAEGLLVRNCRCWVTPVVLRDGGTGELLPTSGPFAGEDDETEALEGGEDLGG